MVFGFVGLPSAAVAGVLLSPSLLLSICGPVLLASSFAGGGGFDTVGPAGPGCAGGGADFTVHEAAAVTINGRAR
jgi:hypothetical protein